MVRMAILLVLLCLTLWEWRYGARKPVYWLAMFALFAFFSLRYGQGTDYLTYMSIYANVPPLYTLPNALAFNYNKIEIGFFYLISFFRMFGLHYVIFIAIVTLFSLLCLNRFIRKFCPQPLFALTFFFAVYSLTYMESGIRQLLAISIALGFVMVEWVEKKRVRAIFGIIVASLLHTSAALLLLLPILFWNDRRMFLFGWKKRTTLILGALLVAGAAVVNFVDLTFLIQLLPAKIEYTILSYYQENSAISPLALANRALFTGMALVLAWRAKERMGARLTFLFNLYVLGFAVYLLFMRFELIASRTNVYFRIVEIALLPALLHLNRDLVRRTVVALPVFLVLLSFLYVKDISAIMGFAQYYGSNPIHYPYVTVFNVDALLENKFVNVKNANAMNIYATGNFSWDDYYAQLQRKPVVRSPLVPY